jgi:hypothetical protein
VQPQRWRKPPNRRLTQGATFEWLTSKLRAEVASRKYRPARRSASAMRTTSSSWPRSSPRWATWRHAAAGDMALLRGSPPPPDPQSNGGLTERREKLSAGRAQFVASATLLLLLCYGDAISRVTSTTRAAPGIRSAGGPPASRRRPPIAPRRRATSRDNRRLSVLSSRRCDSIRPNHGRQPSLRERHDVLHAFAHIL